MCHVNYIELNLFFCSCMMATGLSKFGQQTFLGKTPLLFPLHKRNEFMNTRGISNRAIQLTMLAVVVLPDELEKTSKISSA